MKTFLKYLAYPLSILLLPIQILAQVPGGGTVLNTGSGSVYQRIGECTLTEVPVEGMSFSTALQLTTGPDIPNSWNAQVKFQADSGVEAGDVVLVVFYARTLSSIQETGEGLVTVCIEHNTTYVKEIYYNISIGQDWKEYYARVQIQNSLLASEANYSLHIGFSSQTIEVAETRFINYKNSLTLEDLPITEITYAGQAQDAPWRTPAQERIEQYRKGPARITVVDGQGQAVPGASVSIEMTEHRFGFGTAIAAATFNDNPTYREKLYGMFNEVVFENDLKWPQFHPESSNDPITLALDTLDAHHIGVRGHNVIWPSFRFCPDYVESLQNDPVNLTKVINDRIDDVTTFTAGRLIDWDVINEPYSEHDLQDILGNQVMADWFKRVRRNDRGVRLYLNDYSILSAGGKNLVKQDSYINLVRYIDSLGGEVDGIGLQGHFSSELTSINRVYEILDRFAELGKEIKITEHDISTDQRGVQADYTRDFLTIVFSHPAVKSLLVWGFWEGKHWKPDAAFYNEDWTLRPNGEAWLDLVRNQWWTEAIDTVSDQQGNATFDGFLGTYRYSVTLGEVTRTGTFSLDSSNATGATNQIWISLEGSVPEQVEIVPSRPGYLCEGEEVSLKAPYGSALDYAWTLDGAALPSDSAVLVTGTAGLYKVVVTLNEMEIGSDSYEVEVRPSPESQITVEGGLNLCQGESTLLKTNVEEGESLEWFRGASRIAEEGPELLAENSGSYYLVTTKNGCSAFSEPVQVTIGLRVEVGIEAVGDLRLCEGEDVLLRTDPIPGQVYTWVNGDTVVKSGDFRLNTDSTGSYSVFTVMNGCVSSSDTLTVEVIPVAAAAIEMTGDPSFCEGTTITLSASGGEGGTYLWKLGDVLLDQEGETIEVTEEGSYTLITDMDGCTAESEPVALVKLPATDPGCTSGIPGKAIRYTVYPNPSRGTFLLSPGTPFIPGASFCLYDAQGHLVLHRTIDPGTPEIRIETGDPGIYFLRVVNGEKVQSFRLTSL